MVDIESATAEIRRGKKKKKDRRKKPQDKNIMVTLLHRLEGQHPLTGQPISGYWPTSEPNAG